MRSALRSMRRRVVSRAGLVAGFALLTMTLAGCSVWPAGASASAATPRPVKVMIITMFAPEAEPWLGHWHFDASYRVPGLSDEFPAVRCTTDDVCIVTTGMGHANAAASTTALVLANTFDLSHTWFIVAGIAGIDPNVGTIGSAAWARYLVDYGLSQEIDAREMPAGWATGYIGIGAGNPSVKPKLDYHTELVQLDEALLQRALAMSKTATLADDDKAKAYRQLYAETAARAAPSVIQCDTAGGDTWWHGSLLGSRATHWTSLLTDGKGIYCTTQQEDNATYEAMRRGAAAGKLDIDRVAVLRTGANFDRPHAGQSALDSLNADAGGFAIATENLFIAASPLVRDIVSRWPRWRDGVPPPP